MDFKNIHCKNHIFPLELYCEKCNDLLCSLCLSSHLKIHNQISHILEYSNLTLKTEITNNFELRNKNLESFENSKNLMKKYYENLFQMTNELKLQMEKNLQFLNESLAIIEFLKEKNEKTNFEIEKNNHNESLKILDEIIISKNIEEIIKFYRRNKAFDHFYFNDENKNKLEELNIIFNGLKNDEQMNKYNKSVNEFLKDYIYLTEKYSYKKQISDKILEKDFQNVNCLKGRCSKKYWQTKHMFAVGNGAREETYEVEFNKKLYYVPNVIISLNGFDLDNKFNQRINIKLNKVTNSGFSFNVLTCADSIIWGFDVDWIALKP